MEPASAAQTRLLSVLSSHQIPLGKEDVGWVFENAKTASQVTQWVQRHLSDETIVTLEELEIYNHLKKTGALSKLQKQHPELSLVRPRDEGDLRVEVEGLRESTEMLREHRAQLRRQKAGLKAMREKAKADRERKKKLDERRRRKWMSQREDLQAGIDDLLSILKEEIVDLKQYMKERAVGVEGVNKMLESDDRVLGRLERLAGGVIVGVDDGQDAKDILERVTTLVKKLSVLSASAVRARLDRIFAEVVGSTVGSSDEPDSETADLLKDLESLIPSVAEMAAEQEFLQPVIKEVQKSRMKAGEGLRLGGAYIQDVLSHLQKRNKSTAEGLKIELSKQRAISQVIATITHESVSPLVAPATPAPSTPPPLPPSGNQATGPAKSPIPKYPFRNMPLFTPPPRHRRGRSLDMAIDEDEFPELRMLTLLGISLPTPAAPPLFASPLKPGSAPPSAPPTPVINEKDIRNHIAQQALKLKSQEKDFTTGKTETDEAWNVARILESAIKSGNEYPGNNLIGDELVARLASVESTVGIVAGKIEGVAVGLEELARAGGDLSGRREKRVFVDRWGR